DGYIDVEATKHRIEQRTMSALVAAREALAQAEREAASADAKLARVRSHYQEGRVEAEDWAEQRPGLVAGLAAAQEAVGRAQDHVREVEQAGMPGDAELVLLEHLAAVKRAVTAGVGAAPDLAALRNVIGQMFKAVELVRVNDWAAMYQVGKGGFLPLRDDVGPVPTIGDEPGYYLVPVLRWSFVDRETLSPMRQAIPWSPGASDRSGRLPLCPSDNRTPTGSCAGTAGGSPRRS